VRQINKASNKIVPSPKVTSDRKEMRVSSQIAFSNNDRDQHCIEKLTHTSISKPSSPSFRAEIARQYERIVLHTKMEDQAKVA
jgi:hypothetical protein